MSLIPAPGTPEVNPKHGALTGGDRYRPGAGNGGYRLTAYDIDVDIKLSAGRLDGLVVITAEATQALSRFSLDLSGLVASKVSVNGAKASKFSQDDGKLVIRPARPLAAGAIFTVMVQYGGFPHAVRGPLGGGWTPVADAAGGSAVGGVSVGGFPSGAATWFPCDDRANARAAVTIRCGCDPTALVVASGTPSPVVARNGRNRWVFTVEEPIAVGSLGLQIGRFEAQPLATRTREGTDTGAKTEAGQTTETEEDRTLAVLERLLGPLPVDGVTAVIRDDDLVPLFAHSLVTLGRSDTVDPRGFERLRVRALAFQWFGASLTPATLADTWLSSGFCRYAEWLWSENRGGGASADELARQYIATAGRHAHSGLDDVVVSDPGPSRIADDRVGGRGALTLHALRLAVGDDVFFVLLRSWVTDNRSRTVSTADFLAHTARSCDVPVHELLAAWLTREPLPALPAASR
jgi:aminopeptidase N